MAENLKGKGETVKWQGALKNVPCFLLGNGPSLKDKDLSILNNYFTFGINRIFKKIDPTILFWQDLSLWLENRDKIKKLNAVKLCRKGAETENYCYHFLLKRKQHLLTKSIRYLYGRGNTSALAFQAVYALGCNPVFLVGIDCKYDKNKNTNFYGINKRHKKHTIPQCKKALEFIKKQSNKIKIYSCSNDDIFKNKITIKEAIDMSKEKNREYFVDKLF